KGLLFQASFEQRDYAQPGSRPDFQSPIRSWLGDRYPALGEKYQEWTSLRTQIARSVLEGPGPDGIHAHRERLARWNRSREDLETQLARKVPGMNLSRTLQRVTEDEVATRLPPGAALVELVRIQTPVGVDWPDYWPVDGRYVAFVLLSGERRPVRLIDLGAAS